MRLITLNIIKYPKYLPLWDQLKSTSENYIIEGKDIVFNDGKKVIISDKNALITDNDGNKIYLDNFEYQIEKIFSNQ